MSDQHIILSVIQTPDSTIQEIRAFIPIHGESAYEYAVRVDGFVGTEVEYYAQFRQVFIQADEPIGAMDGSIWIQPY